MGTAVVYVIPWTYCPRVIWTVLKTNQKASDFYVQLGGIRDEVWDSWSLTPSAISNLAGS